VTITQSTESTEFGMQYGGGVNLLLTDRVGLQAGADYVRVMFEDGGATNGARVAAGIVIPF
jgi:hypothetical protein